MTDKEFKAIVEQVSKETGAEFDRPVKEYQGWEFGERARILEDDEQAGNYEGDVGYVVPEEVGAKEYGNLQVKLYFLPDGNDVANDVSPDNLTRE